jgi:hypothetical protein
MASPARSASFDSNSQRKQKPRLCTQAGLFVYQSHSTGRDATLANWRRYTKFN